MAKYRNINSVYELVDAIQGINGVRSVKCAICELLIDRNSNRLVCTYSQVSGVLLQKKNIHTYHTPPNIYTAVKGFNLKCRECHKMLTVSERFENSDLCYKCFDKEFTND